MRDAGCLASGVFTIRPGADHLRIGASLDPAKYRVVTTIKKIFHHARERGQVFRSAEKIAICAQKVIRSGLIGAFKTCLGFDTSSLKSGLRHLFAAAGAGVVDYEKLCHCFRLAALPGGDHTDWCRGYQFSKYRSKTLGAL